jgi:TRAP-type C4-dicarboxylate transport system substrate-binding protein
MPKTLIRRAIAAGVVALGLAGAAPAVGRPASAEEPTRVRLATLAPRGSSYHQLLLAMGERWRQASGGRVALTIYTDGTMGGEADVIRRMRVGQLHAAMLTVVGLSEIDSSVTALETMPLMFRTLDELDYVREKLAPVLEERLLTKGFVVLFWGDAGWVRFFSKEPVVRPADLKKLRMFVWAGDTHSVDIMKRAGYHPVPLEPNDILPGLQTGLISAVPAVPFFALAGQLYRPASHMLELNWAPLVGAAVITKKAWDALPLATRDTLLNAARETGAAIKARSRAEGEEAVETMKKRGLKVHPLTPEVEAEWRMVAEDFYPQIRGRLVPADLFDEVRRLLQEYRASSRRSTK